MIVMPIIVQIFKMLANFEPYNQPVSTDQPTGEELESTSELEDLLHERHCYFTDQELEQRESVLEGLQIHVQEFVQTIFEQSGQDPELRNSVRGQLFSFGSTYLKVANRTSDIDTVVVCPHFVNRSNFFSSFYKILQGDHSIQKLRKIEKASVPIIKLEFGLPGIKENGQDVSNSVSIDIAFAALDQNIIDKDIDITSDDLIDNMDDWSVNSLNGLRTNQMIEKLVGGDMDHFRTFLRFLKLWAKERRIDGNKFGYFGGVNLAILATFITQRYPNAVPASLIYHFFKDLAEWNWANPIMINTPTQGPKSNQEKDRKEFKEYMIITTPAYPSKNSMSSCFNSSRKRIMHEIRRGSVLAENAIKNGSLWKTLIKPSPFFIKYRTYICIEITADTPENFLEFEGVISVKIKALASEIEKIEFIKGAYPYPEMITRTSEEDGTELGDFFIGVMYHISRGENITRILDLSPPCVMFKKQIDAAKRSDQMKMRIRNYKYDSLPDYVFPKGQEQNIGYHHGKKLPSM